MASSSSNIIFFPSEIDYLNYYPQIDGLVSPSDLFRMHHDEITFTDEILHLTNSVDSIIAARTLYSSAGGLLGGVYVVPSRNKQLHSLAKFISERESVILGNEPMELGLLCAAELKIGVVDYLNMGVRYLDIYNDSQELQSLIPKTQLDNVTVAQVQLIDDVLKLFSADKVEEGVSIILGSEILQSLYFEIIMEYLFRRMPPKLIAGKYELNVDLVKGILFSLNPDLSNGFSIKRITSTPSEVDMLINEKQNNPKLLFRSYIKECLERYINKYLDTPEKVRGSAAFRCFKTRRQFEKGLAEVLWAEANNKNINCLTYRLAKGEMALLPCPRIDVQVVEFKDGKLNEKNTAVLKISGLHSSSLNGTLRNPYTKGDWK